MLVYYRMTATSGQSYIVLIIPYKLCKGQGVLLVALLFKY